MSLHCVFATSTVFINQRGLSIRILTAALGSFMARMLRNGLRRLRILHDSIEEPPSLRQGLFFFLFAKITQRIMRRRFKVVTSPLNCKDVEAYQRRFLSRRIKKLGWVKLTRLTMSSSFFLFSYFSFSFQLYVFHALFVLHTKVYQLRLIVRQQHSQHHMQFCQSFLRCFR